MATEAQLKRARGCWRAIFIVFLALALLIAAFLVNALFINPPPPLSPEQRAEREANQEARTEADFRRNHATFTNAIDSCNNAWDAMIGAMNQVEVYRAYDAARQGSAACMDASTIIRDIHFTGPIPGDARDALNAAAGDCGLAMVGRKRALDQAATVLDGNARPSAIAELRNRSDWAQSEALDCMTRYDAAVASTGYELPDE